jgi:hypothetical protein
VAINELSGMFECGVVCGNKSVCIENLTVEALPGFDVLVSSRRWHIRWAT